MVLWAAQARPHRTPGPRGFTDPAPTAQVGPAGAPIPGAYRPGTYCAGGPKNPGQMTWDPLDTHPWGSQTWNPPYRSKHPGQVTAVGWGHPVMLFQTLTLLKGILPAKGGENEHLLSSYEGGHELHPLSCDPLLIFRGQSYSHLFTMNNRGSESTPKWHWNTKPAPKSSTTPGLPHGLFHHSLSVRLSPNSPLNA